MKALIILSLLGALMAFEGKKTGEERRHGFDGSPYRRRRPVPSFEDKTLKFHTIRQSHATFTTG